MILHVCGAFEDGAAGVMTTLRRSDPVLLSGVSEQVFALGTLEGAAVLEAGHRRPVPPDVVCLHVSLQGPAVVEALTAGGTEEALAAASVLWMHAGQVAPDGVSLHG